MNERNRIMKKHYNIPQTEVVALESNIRLMDQQTTSIQLPPEMGAPKRRTPAF